LELKRVTDGRALTEALEEKITWFYYNTLSYGFCYNLRNHALHHASPLHVIDVKINGQKNDLIILIDKASIIGNKALNAKFRERFLEYPEDAVDLYKMLQDYYLMHLHLFTIIHEHFSEEIEDGRKFLGEIRKSIGKTDKGYLAIGTRDDALNSIQKLYRLQSNSLAQFDKEYRYSIKIKKKLNLE
jgi:hypothetical protein